MNYDEKKGSLIPILDKQIKQFKSRLKTYPAKEKNLYDLLSHEEVTKDYVLDAIRDLKKRREAEESQLQSLIASRNQSFDITQIKDKLTKLSQGVREFMQGDLSLEDKRRLLDDFSVQIKANPGNYTFTCIIDTELSADYDEEIISETHKQLKVFEKKHPEISFGDIVDIHIPMPEDTPFGIVINDAKRKVNPDLVTIERTWG